MGATSFWDIQALWRAALEKDSLLQAWAQQEYQRPCMVQTGIAIEVDDEPGEADAPLVGILDSAMPSVFGPSVEHDVTRLRVVCCVYDERFGGRTLRGLEVLARSFGPHVLRVLSNTPIDKLTSIAEIQDSYELADAPMLYRIFEITLKTGRPIGSRRTV